MENNRHKIENRIQLETLPSCPKPPTSHQPFSVFPSPNHPCSLGIHARRYTMKYNTGIPLLLCIQNFFDAFPTPTPAPISSYIVYIYIIHTPNLGFEIAVSVREREQGRFRGSRGGARGSSERALREHGRATREQEGARGSSKGSSQFQLLELRL